VPLEDDCARCVNFFDKIKNNGENDENEQMTESILLKNRQ
jgi:hypothetical protein